MTGKKQTLIIHARLPSRNEAENKARTHWSCGASLKKDATQLVALCAKQQKIAPYSGRVRLNCSFFEPNKKRDADNVFAGVKYILDGLVQAGVLPNDSRKYVEEIAFAVKVDKQNPRVEVEIGEEENHDNT